LHRSLVVARGKPQEFHYCLGVLEGANQSPAAAGRALRKVAARLKRRETVTAEAGRVRDWFDRHLGVLQCALPDPAVQRQINTWTPLNTVHAARYSRATNTWAPGTRGVGFRDTAQDMIAIAYRNPEWAARTLLFLLAHQFADGHTVHTLYPHDHRPPDLSIRSDNHLWLPMLVHAILAETGDMSLLTRTVPFLAADARAPGPAATVWRHLVAAAEFTERHLGSHGIPLILRSDWNDLIGKFSREGRGESVFAAFQYVHVLRLLIEMAELIRDGEREAWLRDCLARQLASLQGCAWDGRWWRRAFDDAGEPVGSVKEPGERIFLNPQSWAVIAGVGTPGQQAAGLAAAEARLDLGFGLKLLDPAFAGWDGDDRLVGYGPGCGENGAVFCHANTWAIQAEAMLGNSGRAWRYFRQLIPHNVIARVGIDTYRAEPYAWVSNIVGPGNRRIGWGNVEQISGTAAWMDVVATQYLLGIRPELRGLVIQPCLPDDWRSADVTRVYRGCEILFRLRCGKGGNCHVQRMHVDGELVAENALVTELYLQGKNRAVIDVVLE
jgi:cellobiose phosphorylase